MIRGNWQEEQLAELLHATLAVKQWFIETDEFDQAERRLLNFGHTWGHALESATSFAIPHGLAVAIGMLAAIRFTQEQPSSATLWNHCLALLSPVIEPNQLEAFNPDRFLQAFRADKKHSPGHIHLIVPTAAAPDELGVEEVCLPDTESSQTLVLQSMREALALVEQQIRVSPVFSSPGASALAG